MADWTQVLVAVEDIAIADSLFQPLLKNLHEIPPPGNQKQADRYYVSSRADHFYRVGSRDVVRY